MKHLLHRYRAIVILAHDVTMAGAAFVASAYLRLGEELFGQWRDLLEVAFPVFLVTALAVFAGLRLHRSVWRYISLQEILEVMRAAALVILVFLPAMFLLTRLADVPRSLLVITWFVMVALLCAPRVLYRLAHDRSLGRLRSGDAARPVPVLLVGAGAEADMFIRAMARNLTPGYRVVGLLDDAEGYDVGRRIQGIPILGRLEALEETVARLDRRGDRPQRLILTREHVDGALARRLLDRADALGLSLGRLPALTAFKAGVNEGIEVRDFAVEDLLGRPQTVLDRAAMRRLVEGRRVLVTGAGGTIGSELVRQVAALDPARVVLLNRSEFGLYTIDQELASSHPELPRAAVLCDVQDRARVDRVLQRERPEIVFHAAALKHVPIAEENPEEAVLTNAVGTVNMAEACIAAGVAAMVLISTDKAVHPTSVMGATKRLAELYCMARASRAPGTATRLLVVRFGNVLGSTGSVVPLFRRQLERGGPLTVTDRGMTRYFMTTREAVELVLEATAVGARADAGAPGIFVLDMGEPVAIDDLARQMIRLAGLRPGRDIEIAYTGIRPGEKLHEELFYPGEAPVPADYPGLLFAAPEPPDAERLTGGLETLAAAARAGERARCLALLHELVPDYGEPGDRTGVVVALRS